MEPGARQKKLPHSGFPFMQAAPLLFMFRRPWHIKTGMRKTHSSFRVGAAGGTRPALYAAPSTFGSPHGRLGPQPARQHTVLSHCGCALPGPSPLCPFIAHKNWNEIRLIPVFSLVRPTGLEPVRPADTSTSSLPVCQFQHSRTSDRFQFFVNNNILLASGMFVNIFLGNRAGFYYGSGEGISLKENGRVWGPGTHPNPNKKWQKG